MTTNLDPEVSSTNTMTAPNTLNQQASSFKTMPGFDSPHQQASSLDTMSVVIFALNGDLTLNTDQGTLEMIKRHVKAKTQTILLDMKHIGFVDSAGLALLIQLCKFSMSLGIRLALCSISEQMNQLLLLTSTGSLFEVFDSQESFYREWVQEFPPDATLPPIDSMPVIEVTTE